MKLHGFGQRISSALQFREWTQGQLSLRSGVGQSHISQILRERKMPRLDIAAALARALDVSLDWLAGLPERSPEALAPDEAELLRLYRQLNSDTFRELALTHVRNLAAITKVLATVPPYGYRINANTDLEVLPEEARWVRWMFERRVHITNQ